MSNSLWYILPPTKHFWRWSADGTAIEWTVGQQSNQTVCVREELEEVLAELADEGLPSLDLIITLIQCLRTRMFIRLFGEKLLCDGKERLTESAQFSLNLTKRLLDLPAEWHTGRKRTLLLRTLLKPAPKVLSAADAKQYLLHLSSISLPQPQAEFQQKTFDALRLLTVEEAVQNVLTQLSDIYIYFMGTDLDALLKAGISDPPEEIEAPLPVPPETGDLMQELLEDPQTAGIARLTLRIQAAARIPMHNAAAGDIRVGGVSDITNKGDISALLLSELAQDDDVLAARLAHQEALYLRRESPPVRRPRARLLLIDSTLLSWGEPRLFAMATALSAARQTEGIVAFNAIMLGEKDRIPATLSTRDGILEAVSVLDRGVHCMNALERALAELPADTEVIFITHQEGLDYTDAATPFAALKKRLNYYYLLDRTGEMRFFQVLEGNSRMIARATFPLSEILFGVSEKSGKNRSRASRSKQPLPTLNFYQAQKSPLRYPPPSIALAPHTVTVLSDGSSPEVAVFHEGDILYWNESGAGGYRIFTNVPAGMYFIMATEHLVSLLVYHEQQRRLLLYRYQKNGDWRRDLDYAKDFIVAEKIGKTEKSFVLFGENKNLIINAENGVSHILNNRAPIEFTSCAIHTADKKRRYGMGLLQHQDDETQMNLLKNAARFVYTQNIHTFWQYPNLPLPDAKCFNCLPPTNLIYITRDNQLKVGKMVLKADRHLMWLPANSLPVNASHSGLATPMQDAGRPQRRYLGYRWKNGAQIIIDSAGFIHLIPPENFRPQVTILHHKYYVAAWASDGKVTGNTSFLLKNSLPMPVPEFYNKYIYPFIRQIAGF